MNENKNKHIWQVKLNKGIFFRDNLINKQDIILISTDSTDINDALIKAKIFIDDLDEHNKAVNYAYGDYHNPKAIIISIQYNGYINA